MIDCGSGVLAVIKLRRQFLGTPGACAPPRPRLPRAWVGALSLAHYPTLRVRLRVRGSVTAPPPPGLGCARIAPPTRAVRTRGPAPARALGVRVRGKMAAPLLPLSQQVRPRRVGARRRSAGREVRAAGRPRGRGEAQLGSGGRR